MHSLRSAASTPLITGLLLFYLLLQILNWNWNFRNIISLTLRSVSFLVLCFHCVFIICVCITKGSWLCFTIVWMYVCVWGNTNRYLYEWIDILVDGCQSALKLLMYFKWVWKALQETQHIHVTALAHSCSCCKGSLRTWPLPLAPPTSFGPPLPLTNAFFGHWLAHQQL